MTSLRIAILTHSTNPRGGVSHCLALAEALCGLGHEAVVHAPDPSGRGFFRAAGCPTVPVAAEPVSAKSVSGGTVALVRARIADYLRHFTQARARGFDVFHAHDGIGGNALATLRERGTIHGFVRTVHHLDTFADPQLAAWQERAVREASRLLCVSRTWADRLADAAGARPDVVGNGVDPAEFHPAPTEEDARARARCGLGPGPIVLGVGGFEERKNTAAIIAAFALLRRRHPSAQLVVAGGASLLDHAPYRARCRALIAAEGLSLGPGCAVVETGPVPQAEMPALYRIADVLAFPSWVEGFGLCVLEAMASGTPTVVSRLAPFTEYLGEGDTLFVDPADARAVTGALEAALDPGVRDRLRAAGTALAARHSWRACAERHLDAYAACRAPSREMSHA